MTTIKSSSTAYSVTRSTSFSPPATSTNDVMVGFDDDLLAIKEQLCGVSTRRQVIPIVGMGGIGKTTLAINAYNDPSIQLKFHFGGWVTVSQSYSLEDILSRLHQSLKSFDPNKVEESNEYAAATQGNGTEDSDADKSKSLAKVFENRPASTADLIYKTLKGRKYLVVMDDIWNYEVFDRLNRLFPDDDNGSRVILTTRLQNVATYANDCSPHEMQLMHEDQSWNLLRKKVFINGVCNPELENIGIEIARSCGGLPLAIVVTAGLLATAEKTQAAWKEIAEKVSSTIAAEDGQFEKILSLSYTHLPHHLRQCFVYMGGFPEDSMIHVANLIKLWIAEGFIHSSDASKSLEQVAGECLHDLIKRSLVFMGEKKPHGEIKSCSLHDLVRDLCIRKAGENFPIHDPDVYGTFKDRFKGGQLEEVINLRVMDAGKSSVGEELYMRIPEQMFRLANLRYLVLAHHVEIPAAISRLENLQTFIIYPMEGWIRLPQEIWTMPQLRHLISSFDPLPYPEGEARRENLQTLWEVNNLEFTHILVEMIPGIKKLGLVYSESYGFQQYCFPSSQFECSFNRYDYNLENLERLHHLEKLKMRVYPGFPGILNPVFPLSLKKLSLTGFIVPSWNDMKTIGSLPNLQVLKLRDFDCKDARWETAEGEFTNLRFLLIARSDIREWITEREHFPKLKQLLLHYCGFLDEIPSDIGEIPTLELIEVKEGSTLLVKSVRRIEEEQKELENDSLKVSCR